MNKHQLTKFLGKAQLNTYAGGGAEIKPAEKEFHDLEYKEGDWYYKDSYAGHYQSWGRETVWYKNKPVWTQLYGGGIEEKLHNNKSLDTKLYSFLKKAMSAGDKENTFQPRGPIRFTDKDFKYECEWEGDIQKFKGNEKIFFKEEIVFTHNFIGGTFE